MIPPEALKRLSQLLQIIEQRKKLSLIANHRYIKRALSAIAVRRYAP